MTLAFSPLATASIGGSLKSSTDFFQQKQGEPTEDLIPYGEIQLNGKHKFTKKWRWQWKLTAVGQFEASDNGNTEKMPFNEKLFADLPEAFLEFKTGNQKFRAGMNTINWGVADVYSPSSVVNTSAFFSPLRSYKRGSPMVEWQAGGESFGLHAVYVPRQPRAILPETHSRWLPRSVLINAVKLPEIDLPEVPEYSYAAERELDHARTHNYGLKLNSRIGSVDLQVTHFEGASPFPKVSPNPVINSSLITNRFYLSNPIRLIPISYRTRTTGGGLTWAREKWIYRLETAYQHSISKNALIQPYSWTSVAGIETNIELGSSALTVIAQYYYTQNPQSADNQISSGYRLFDRTGALGLRWPINETWTVGATGLYETVSNGLFWTANLENKFADSLKLAVGWRDFSAAEPGLIKTFDKNDHATLDLTYFF